MMLRRTIARARLTVLLQRYRDDAYDVLTTYWSTWPAVHFVSFTLLPPELRIAFVASASFLWLIYLSFASHKTIEAPTTEATQAEKAAQ